MTCENSVVTSNLYKKSSHFAFFITSKSPQTSSLSHETTSTVWSVTVYYTSLVEPTRLGQLIWYVTLNAQNPVDINE